MSKIGFIVCSIYAKELQFVITNSKLQNVEVSVLPATCGSLNPKERALFNTKYEALRLKTSNVNILLAEACSGCSTNTSDSDENNRHCPSICLSNFIPPKLLNFYIEKNYYITTTGWVKQWKYIVIKHWQFTQDIAKMFFSEMAMEILVLDTGVIDDYETDLLEFSTFIGLKYNILPIGIDYFRQNIENLVYIHQQKETALQLEKIKKEQSQKISEYAMVIDLIPMLSKINSEDLVIQQIFELYTILFAPEHLHYLKISRNKSNKFYSQNSDFCNEQQFLELCNFDHSYIVTEEKRGFISKIIFDNQIYGYLWVENIQFPEHLQRYINLSISLTSFFGLLISNALQFEELESTKNIAEDGKQKFEKLTEKYIQLNEALNISNQEYESLNEELKQSIEEISALNESLESTNIHLNTIIATKDKFFSIIAHDLKNPFNSLLGFSQLLVKNAPIYSPERIQSFAQNIYNSSKTTYELIENLLEWARLQTETLEPNFTKLEPSELIDEVRAICEPMAITKNITLKIKIAKNDSIFADKEMIKTVLRNLVTNAIKFTYSGGSIFIITEKAATEILFTVQDTGIGIEEEHLNKIFNINNKLSKKGTANETGTGLGLILCKEFIDKHKGKIWVESEIGKGSNFKFTIPTFQI